MVTKITFITLSDYFYYFQEAAVQRSFGMEDAPRNIKNLNTIVLYKIYVS